MGLHLKFGFPDSMTELAFGMGLHMQPEPTIELTQEMLLEQQQSFRLEMRQKQPSELWENIDLLPGYGGGRTKDAWFEDIRGQILEDLQRNGDCLVFLMLIGEPGSGKTKLAHDLAVQLVYGRTPEDNLALCEAFAHEGSEILVSTYDWGAPFNELPSGIKVPAHRNYRKNSRMRGWKHRELGMVSDIYEAGFVELCQRYYYQQDVPSEIRRDKRVAHIVLCDYPGPTGLPEWVLPPDQKPIGFDRGVQVVRNLINHTGPFRKTGMNHRVIPLGLVASATVLENNRQKRHQIWTAQSEDEIADLMGNVIAVNAEDQTRAMRLYKQESASRWEIVRLEKDIDDYIRGRLAFDEEWDKAETEPLISRINRDREERQELMASYVIPDFMINILGIPQDEMLMLYNGTILPNVSFSTAARHRPLEDLRAAGRIDHITHKSTMRLLNNYFKQAWVTL